ncbi:MAG: glycoside hydrolase family 1 protein [Brevinemataceae bacterium]
MFYQFPKDFWWGAASSGPQHEGAADIDGREPSVWDEYYKTNPHRFFNEVGPSVCGDFYHRFKEDLILLKELGLNSYRTSIQWSRLLPYQASQPNPQAVKFYHQVIDTMLELELQPFLALHHFDLPWSYQLSGGWENRDTVKAYTHFAETCFKLFGDKVKYWFTFNEPIVVPYIAYMDDYMYPNVIDMHRGMTTAYHTALAHAEAVNIFRQGKFDGKIGIILNISPSYPRSQHPEDQKAAYLADLFHNESFKQPALKGSYSQELIEFMSNKNMPLPIHSQDKETFAQGKVDILGINYYSPQRVKAKEHLANPLAPIRPNTFFDPYEMPGRKLNPYRGWEIYSKGIYDSLTDIRTNYGNIETFISENGMGVENEDRFRNSEGFIDDQYRIEFIKDHLTYVHKAISEGCNCKGYHLWTLVDNWSWQNAYKNRYGYIELQLHNNLKRVIKQSGYWIKNTALNSGFEL